MLNTKKLESVNDVLLLQTPQHTGVNYFIANPSEFTKLIQADFGLASQYVDYFTSQDVNAMVNQMRAKHQTTYLGNYVVIEDMFRLLIDQSQRSSRHTRIHVKNLPSNNKSIDAKITELLPFCSWIDGGDYYYYYSYENFGAVFYHTRYKSFEQAFQSTNVFYKSLEFLNNTYDVFLSRNYALTHLPDLITRFLNKIEPNNLLDFEFLSRYASSNDSLSLLVRFGHYQTAAAFLKHLSPLLAMNQLMGNMSSGNASKKDVLDFMIEKLPASLPVMTQAIECMQQLKFADVKAFEAFIESPRADLLKSIKERAPGLQDTFLAIHPEFLKAHFESAKGLTMPAEKVNLSTPPAWDSPPPYSLDAPVSGAAVLQFSKSSVSSSNIVEKEPDNASNKCAVM